jgi:hypothetical protein
VVASAVASTPCAYSGSGGLVTQTDSITGQVTTGTWSVEITEPLTRGGDCVIEIIVSIDLPLNFGPVGTLQLPYTRGVSPIGTYDRAEQFGELVDIGITAVVS